ncbi:hypothetical protein A9P82_01085 [Arachidicoccus ginsenosidimutans]|uniref:FecR family protein n=1 Tax=Arachidicoccus sp. BS20 TaxID=1850526 RepID=UPI0007F06294|nr:FecR family protein [Arachidicoccus sp. BS20]ANI88036.1 hypothetical protein A9P82_01085 [Arachidicoccus sp. BS20]
MSSILHKKQLQKLIKKFLDGHATTEEIAFLEKYYAHYEQEADILETLPQENKQHLSVRIERKILQRIHSDENNSATNKKAVQPAYRWAAAAAVFLLLSLSGYLFIQKRDTKTKLQLAASAIVPGHNGAILTLSNGTKILLDSAGQGSITSQGNMTIVNRNGAIAYINNPADEQTTNAVTYNMLETPRGRRFKVTLPDGTQVWLNSASSLKYPTAFNGSERDVELTGEAYFEVIHNEKKPFIVHTSKTKVRVLGTGFNVMAYNDESAERTTLIHGLVRVSALNDSSKQVIIHPGQQAILRANNTALNVRQADTSETLAWLNGNFIFNNRDIKYIMRQIARWYDISVQYQGNVDNVHFEGLLSKRENIGDILEAIQTTNEVHFKVEGRTITVIAGKTE